MGDEASCLLRTTLGDILLVMLKEREPDWTKRRWLEKHPTWGPLLLNASIKTSIEDYLRAFGELGLEPDQILAIVHKASNPVF